jgi:hypothetical protein
VKFAIVENKNVSSRSSLEQMVIAKELKINAKKAQIAVISVKTCISKDTSQQVLIFFMPNAQQVLTVPIPIHPKEIVLNTSKMLRIKSSSVFPVDKEKEEWPMVYA